MHVNKCSIAGLMAVLFVFCAFVRSEDATIEPYEGGSLISISKCFHLYFNKTLFTSSTSQFVLKAPTKATGSCVGGNITQASNIQIEFPFQDDKNFSKLVLDLSLTAPNSNSSYWSVDSAKTVLTSSKGDEVITWTYEPIEALDKFSYSCNQQQFVNKTMTADYTLELKRFQVQGFEGPVFHESFDCTVWFTLPMWMSLLVILLLLSVISLGISFLVSIQTNDRFEDPRGKPLFIPVSE